MTCYLKKKNYVHQMFGFGNKCFRKGIVFIELPKLTLVMRYQLPGQVISDWMCEILFCIFVLVVNFSILVGDIRQDLCTVIYFVIG